MSQARTEDGAYITKQRLAGKSPMPAVTIYCDADPGGEDVHTLRPVPDARVASLNADPSLWPCERRDAHHAHGDCPGVGAHPATQIGRKR
jgi:hypothetical protein